MRKVLVYSALSLLVGVSGCSSVADHYQVKKSRLAAGETEQLRVNAAPEKESRLAKAKQEMLSPLLDTQGGFRRQSSAAERFSESTNVSFASESMPLRQFVEVLFSQLLKANYVITHNIPTLDEPITLNMPSELSQRKAFIAAVELLQTKSIDVVERDGIFYLLPMVPGQQGQSFIGFGRSAMDVPATAGQVTQIVPLSFGNPGIENTISQLVRINIVRDPQQNLLILTGPRADVVKALDVVRLLDAPAARGKHISFIRLTYLNPEEFSEKVKLLLVSEGIDGVGIAEAANKNLILVPIEHMGAVAVFSGEKTLVDRVSYWALQIDVPSEGAEKRYFVYHPNYARAADLAASVSPLLGGSYQAPGRQGNQSRDTRSAFGANQQQPAANANAASGNTRVTTREPQQAGAAVQNDKLTMTVDERSNTLIFYAAGSDYQAILPMLKRLDVMPKQILLEATIAEVTLTDDFAMGVEFALKNDSTTAATTGAFGLGDVGGLNLGYINGADNIVARLKQSNQLVNVLSNPSLVVRDGVTASILVGSELPSVSSTTTDPLLSDKTTTSISYKQTGLEFSVMPTINGQGLVVMQIMQNISNQAKGSVVEGAPAIFKRQIETEVIAQSGQTILIGGLISENDDSGDTKVPVLGDLPLIGNLFKSRTQKKVKTELVLLITPRVIDATEQWHYINDQLQKGFEHLQISD